MKRPRKAMKFSEDYWVGFSDGKPDFWNTGVYTEAIAPHPVITISKIRREVAQHYEDVRKMKLVEIK